MPFAPKQKKAILDWCLTRQKWFAQSWDRWEAWYVGDDPEGRGRDMGDNRYAQEENEEFRVDTNYMYAFIDTSNAVICPANPQVNIRAVDDARQDQAEAREGLINATFRKNNLQDKLRRAGLFTSLNGNAYCKTSWRIEEQRLVYQMLSPRSVFADHSVPWEDCRYIIEAVPYTREEFEARLADGTFVMPDNRTPTYGQIPVWMEGSLDGKTANYSSAIRDAFERIVVYEFHDLTAPDVCWMLEGMETPLKTTDHPPYKYVRNVYAPLAYNETPKDFSGLADAKLIERPLNKLNELDLLQLWHAFTCIPKIGVNNNAVDDPEAAKTKLQNASGPGDIVDVELLDEKTMSDWLGYTQMPNMLPAFDEMRQRLEGQIEYTLGFPKQQRGGSSGGDTATEVAVTDANSKTRNGARTAMMKKFIKTIAHNTLAIYREFLPDDTEIPIATESDSTEFIDRQALGFDSVDSPISDPKMFDEEWYFEYDIAAATPSENDKAVQLQKLTSYMPIFMQDPTGTIDKGKLMKHAAKLLDAKNIINKNPAPPMPQGPQLGGMPGSEGQAGVPGSIPTNGALPGPMDAQHEATLPPQIRSMASPPKMELA